jgi:two-component system, NtrC family, sensor histidine kinase HydH
MLRKLDEMRSLSLLVKFPIAASLCVIAALLTYLLVDGTLTRTYLLREEARKLRVVGQMLCSDLQTCDDACRPRTQALLDRFAELSPSIELINFDHRSVVIAASRRELVGGHWREEGIQRVLDGELDFHWATMEHSGVPVIDVTVPCRPRPDQPLEAIHVAQTMSRTQEHLSSHQRRHSLAALGASLAVGLILGILTYLLILRRLRRLERTLSASNGAGSAWERQGDEIERLTARLQALVGGLTETRNELERALADKSALLTQVSAFNEALEGEIERVRSELLEAQDELLRTEHISAIGQLTAGLAHELRNPLFIIRATAEAHARDDSRDLELAQDIAEEVDRVDRIISRLLDFGTPLKLERRPVELGEILKDAIEKVRRSTSRAVSMSLDLTEEVTIDGDYSFLRQAFINILTNAVQACSNGEHGRVEVTVSTTSDHAIVIVEDNGEGIAEEDLGELFRPFFTRKAGGTGLGLCTAKKILDLHSSTIEVFSEVGEGTIISMRFRRSQEDSKE